MKPETTKILLICLSVCSLMTVPPVQAANTGGGVFAAYTYINDLGISLPDSQSYEAISRSGVKLGADFSWADIDYQGGPSVMAFANQDTDLGDNRNIANLGVMGNYLQPLSSRWLLRSSLMLERYRNDVVLSTGYDGLGINVTAGYMGDNQQGLDLFFKLIGEDHGQDEADLYSTSRFELGLSYYFSRQANQAFWAVQLRRQDNQADDDKRDYVSTLYGVAYKGWQLNDIWGNLSVQLRQDDYRLANPVQRQDVLYYASLDMFKALGSQWQLRVSLSSGFYESNLFTGTQDYLQASLGLQKRF